MREVERASDDSFVIFRCFAACHQFRVGATAPEPKEIEHDPLDAAIKGFNKRADCMYNCGRERNGNNRACAPCEYAYRKKGIRRKSEIAWRPEEDAAIMAPDRPMDVVLARNLGRTRAAIHMRRVYIRRQAVAVTERSEATS